MMFSPQKMSMIMMTICRAACPSMCFPMFLETMCSCLRLGCLSSRSSVGASVASAREARVSMMRLIHSIWIGANTCCLSRAAPIRVIRTATTLTVSWNWMNLRMESQILRPQRTAFTIELKLSSSRIIEAASLAVYVPEIPIANPTSAFLRAGASLVPSPVTATIYPRSRSPVTRAYLSSGLDRAKTSRLSMIRSNQLPFQMVSTRRGVLLASACLESRAHSHTLVLHCLQTTPPMRLEKSGPSRTKVLSPSLRMPMSLAMAVAVMRLSPVTIRTLMPALWHLTIAAGTSIRGTSLTPIMQSRVSYDFYIQKTPFWSLPSVSHMRGSCLQARQRVRREDQAILRIARFICYLVDQVMIYILFDCMSCHLLQQFNTIYDAPFTNIHNYDPSLCTITDILFLEELKGNFMSVGYLSRQSLYLMPTFSKYLSIAIQVEDPFSSGSRLAVLLTQLQIAKSQVHSLLVVRSYIFKFWLQVSMVTVRQFQIWVRVILFIVRVPVLSEQIVVADPIVSQASILRTRLLSVSIFLTDTARERVTLRGRPSGMATTITVRERMKQLISSGRSVELFQDGLRPF